MLRSFGNATVHRGKDLRVLTVTHLPLRAAPCRSSLSTAARIRAAAGPECSGQPGVIPSPDWPAVVIDVLARQTTIAWPLHRTVQKAVQAFADLQR